jgi:hypothetical protein
MTILGVFLIASLLITWLLLLVYRETEQDFPPAHRSHHLACAGLSKEPGRPEGALMTTAVERNEEFTNWFGTWIAVIQHNRVSPGHNSPER